MNALINLFIYLSSNGLSLFGLTCRVHRGQPRLRRTHDLHPVLREPAAVDRTVPALLRLVPTDHPFQVRAQGRERAHVALAVLVHGDRSARPAVQHAARAGCEILHVGDVALQEALVLGVDLHGVGDHARQAGCDAQEAVGRVDGAPGVGGLGDEVGDDLGAEDVVGEAVAAIAALDIDVRVPLIEADHGDVVDSL